MIHDYWIHYKADRLDHKYSHHITKNINNTISAFDICNKFGKTYKLYLKYNVWWNEIWIPKFNKFSAKIIHVQNVNDWGLFNFFFYSAKK